MNLKVGMKIVIKCMVNKEMKNYMELAANIIYWVIFIMKVYLPMELGTADII